MAWQADPSALFDRRLGRSPQERDPRCDDKMTCPDMWRLTNGDVAVIGQDLTEVYRTRLPDGVSLDTGERLVVIPGIVLSYAKKDIPDA
ncbi:hypothetical protein ND808_17975 [Streptomyces sp. DR7-3]|uniref:hypothetical protein n=1 Tax=Streptomyces malaysiensis TaxID=92644 RepID=UPI002044C69D|nr:hypothetical protein [Streptomyces sp. DR7-3]MCM3807738.1 hypothetical protein [Streptomyces sp. DR7-3]